MRMECECSWQVGEMWNASEEYEQEYDLDAFLEKIE